MAEDKNVIGCAGKYCSGKDLACSILVENGYKQIDIETIYQRTLELNKDLIVNNLGDGVLTEDGTLDKSKLGEVLVVSTKTRQHFEYLVYPLIIEEIISEIDSFKIADSDSAPGIVLNDPRLFYLGLDSLCDKIVWVKAFPWQRVLRAFRRDSSHIVRMLQKFAGSRYFVPRDRGENLDAEIISIYNIQSPEDFKKQVQEIIESL